MSVRRLDPVQPASFTFSPENASRAKKAIAKFPAGKQASAVIQLLWFAQEQEGWVSRPAIETIAKMLDMADIRVLEVATFYTMFQLSPVGRKAHIQVCGTTPCMLRGAEDLIDVCKRKIHPEPHHLNADGTLSWEEVECLGSCVNAPMIQVVKDTYEDLDAAKLEKIIDDFAAGRPVKPGPQNGRHFSMAITGATSLTDKALYGKQRTYQRVEAPPPPPPAPAAAAPAAAPASGTTPPAAPPAAQSQSAPPSPAAVKPAAADIRPVSTAAKVADAQKESTKSAEAASAAPGKVTTEKAQAETGVVRTTDHAVAKAATKKPVANVPVVTRVAKVAAKPSAKKAAKPASKAAEKKSAPAKKAAPKKAAPKKAAPKAKKK